MAHNVINEQQAAARLLAAIDETDELDCEHAEAQIAALVEAEQAGVDVDRNPEFAALLQHLDGCERCMELYAGIAEDIEAVAGETGTLPIATLNPPSFFESARENDSVILRVLQGLTRRFELILTPPRLVPTIANLGSGERVELFADRLPEVQGAPLVAATLNAGEESIGLLVALREATPSSRWEIQLTIGSVTHTQTTDERGIARFSGLPPEALQQLKLLWSELPAQT